MRRLFYTNARRGVTCSAISRLASISARRSSQVFCRFSQSCGVVPKYLASRNAVSAFNPLRRPVLPVADCGARRPSVDARQTPSPHWTVNRTPSIQFRMRQSVRARAVAPAPPCRGPSSHVDILDSYDGSFARVEIGQAHNPNAGARVLGALPRPNGNALHLAC